MSRIYTPLRSLMFVLMLGMSFPYIVSSQPISCSGTFVASSLADLDAYEATDYGRNEDGSFKHLVITGSDLSAPYIEVYSPCSITVAKKSFLWGHSLLTLKGRLGVLVDRRTTIFGLHVNIISEEDNATISTYAYVQAGNLTVEAYKRAQIADRANVLVSDTVKIISTGNFWNALVRRYTIINARSLIMVAATEIRIREDAEIYLSGPLVMDSTKDSSGGKLAIMDRVIVEAEEVFMSAWRETVIGDNVQMDVIRDIFIEGRGNYPLNFVEIGNNTEITSAVGDLTAISATQLIIQPGVVIDVKRFLTLEASDPSQCFISSGAIFNAHSTYGNCFEN